MVGEDPDDGGRFIVPLRCDLVSSGGLYHLLKSSVTFSISRDRFENTVSLGHMYPYLRSP